MTITQPALDQIWAATLASAKYCEDTPAKVADSLKEAYAIIYDQCPNPAAFPKTAAEVEGLRQCEPTCEREKIEIPSSYWHASSSLNRLMNEVADGRQLTGDSDDLRRQLDEMTKVINNTIDQLIQQGR